MKCLLFLAVLATVLAVPGLIEWSSCSSPTASGHIEHVEFENNPAIVGYNTTVLASGYLDKSVKEGAVWKMRMDYLGMAIEFANGDLCKDSIVNLPFGSGAIYITGLKCPQKQGYVKLEQKAIFFKKPLPGKYSIRCAMADHEGYDILCLDIVVPM